MKPLTATHVKYYHVCWRKLWLFDRDVWMEHTSEAVAGGELLIPALVLLYAVDARTAGSLSLLVSLPTMLVAFARYSRDRSFAVLRENDRFVLAMAAGSVAGSFVGGRLLGLVSSAVLLPLLAVILVLSAIKVWCHT